LSQIPAKKNIALGAHDGQKNNLLAWVPDHQAEINKHKLYATGTTGRLLEKELGLSITKLESGPLGGDQQMGARIVEGEIHVLIFFWDPLQTAPHDPDVKALLRIANVWNIAVACNRATADLIISSPYMSQGYERAVPQYRSYHPQ
jgi:methylglyoxal synthase